MITLYSYPELFGVADNNGYGLKVFAFMRLAGVTFRHEHIFDASAAPRGQLKSRSAGYEPWPIERLRAGNGIPTTRLQTAFEPSKEYFNVGTPPQTGAMALLRITAHLGFDAAIEQQTPG